MVFIDIHSHLDILKDLPNVIKRAKEKNVGIILSCGVDVKSNRKVLEISDKFDCVKACLGIYPSDGLKLSDEEIEKEISFIRENRQKVIAIGEIGLDLYKAGNLEKQKKVMERFVFLAKELDIPVIVHSRKAEKEVIEFLENFDYKKILMHCFCGNMKLVNQIIENGWFLSIPTSVKHSEHFRKVIEITPIEQLFCETDSPFLHPDKKFPNEPANVFESYKAISEIKNIKREDVERHVEQNFKRLFRKE
jgi:TatD DNase family protein